MAVIREKEIAGKVVQFKELSVREIRDWLAAGAAPGDAVDYLLFEDVSLPDVPALTSLTAADLDSMAPSEIEQVIDEAKKVNARFFAMRQRMEEMGRAVLEKQPPDLSELSPG